MLNRNKSIHILSNFIKEILHPNIIVLHGAGVSVAAGIPDFRTPRTGFYSRVAKLNLPQPESIFDIEYFIDDPKPFYSIAHELQPDKTKFKPTNCHFFSKVLEDKRKLLRLYTQNIDGLEKMSGLSDDVLCEAHGHFRSAHCTICHNEVSMDELNDAIKKRTPLKCKCGGVAKPDVVFYGENLPTRFFTLSENDFKNCKLLITIGTSLKVFPFAALTEYVPKNVPRFLINNEEAGTFNFHKEQTNDFFIPGDCQQSIDDLVEELGWKNEILKLKQSFIK